MPLNTIIAVLSLFCLASAFITYGLGVAAYVKNSRSELNRLFLLAMVSASYWAFGEFMIWQAGTPEGVWFWLKVSSFWPFVIAFTLHFVLILTSQKIYEKNRFWYIAVIYIPSAIISFILLFTDWIFTVRYLPGTGYAYLPVRDSLAYQAESAFILVIMLFATALIYGFCKRATTRKVKNQGILICLAIVTVIVFGFLSGILLPMSGIYLPNLVFIGIVLFSMFITVAIQKHELFVLSPRTAVPDILRTMPDAMILTDMNGTIISTNNASDTIFNRFGKKLIAKNISTCIPEPAFALLRSSILEKGRITDLETIPAGSETRTISIAGSLVQDPYGEPAGMVLVVRDITDRKSAEKALRIAGEKISLLTQLTRHDINNLVSALSGYLLLLKENPTDPANEAYIASSMDIAKRIHEQIQFTREYQEVGASQPVWQPLGLMISRAASDLPHNGVSVDTQIAPVEIYTDPLAVKVLYNLLENALRHGGHITRIRISTEEPGDTTLRVIVEDNGIGIPEEEKEVIFRYGYGKNTGLGLAISRDILSLTGITIAECGTAGKGARFEMVVPPSAWRLLSAG
jgi:PAS domain S-box-containing protein